MYALFMNSATAKVATATPQVFWCTIIAPGMFGVGVGGESGPPSPAESAAPDLHFYDLRASHFITWVHGRSYIGYCFHLLYQGKTVNENNTLYMAIGYCFHLLFYQGKVTN